MPTKTLVIKATITRMMAKGSSSSEYVTIIESTPVWGVDIRN